VDALGGDDLRKECPRDGSIFSGESGRSFGFGFGFGVFKLLSVCIGQE
jgi:hypothetical protein